MNEQLLTIALLIIVVCNLGVLWLYSRIDRWMQTPNDIFGLLKDIKWMVSKSEMNLILALNRLSEAADRQRGMKQALLDDGKLTRERIAQVKTRMADEERDDQRAKRKEQEIND